MNKLKNSAAKIILAGFAIAIASICLANNNAYAAYDAKSILKRAMVRNLMSCYSKNYITKEFKTIGEFKGAASLHKDGKNSGNFPIPSGTEFSSIQDENLNCKDLVEGYDDIIQKIDSAYGVAGHPVPKANDASVSSFLTTYAGYKPMSNTSVENGRCVYGKFTKTTYANAADSITKKNGKTEPVITNPICVNDIQNGKISSVPEMYKNGSKIGYELGFSGFGSTIYIEPKKEVVKIAVRETDGMDMDYYGKNYTYRDIQYKGVAWDKFVSDISDALGTKVNKVFNREETQVEYDFVWTKWKTVYAGIEDVPGEQAAELTGGYKLDDSTGQKVAAALLGVSAGEVQKNLSISAQEQVHLYRYYLATLYTADVSCDDIDESAAKSNGYDGPIKWFQTGETTVTENCYVTMHNERNYKGKNNNMVNGLTAKGGGLYFETVHGIGYQDLINYFKNLTIEELDDPAGSRASTNDGDSDAAERAPDCHTNAGALGWFLCPVIEAASNAVERVYTGLIEPYLSIDAILFDTNSKGGAAVHQAWSIFQGFANLAFVIIFLFVIFSQLTGVGIDNYGVKKILPKLIIGAVLINMSYVICQLAVDLSNILGRAVGGLFLGMEEELKDGVSKIVVNLNETMAPPVSGKFEPGVLALVGTAAVLGIPAFLSAGFAIIIPAILALVSLIVAVLFLFIMLALRQAIAVVLVVVSPLAFAAYILPNTKRLIFDKWLEAFKGMLIAYPICAALVYGGDFVSKILLYAETGGGANKLTSLGMTLSVAAVAIAPIFFIPSMIRKGMNGIGGLGNVFARHQGNLNNTARGGTGRWIQRSRLGDYQKRREEGREARIRERQVNAARAELEGTRWRDRLAGNKGLYHTAATVGLANMSAAQRARYRNNVRAVTSNDNELTSMYADVFANSDQSQITRSLEMMRRSGNMDTNLATAAITELNKRDPRLASSEVALLGASGLIDNLGDRDLNRFAGCLRGLEGNGFMQAYGRDVAALRGDRSFAGYARSGGLATRLRNMGDHAFDGASHDIFDMIRDSAVNTAEGNDNPYGIDLSSAMTAGQWANILGASYSGNDLTSLNNLISATASVGGQDQQVVQIPATVGAELGTRIINMDSSTLSRMEQKIDGFGESVGQACSRIMDSQNQNLRNSARSQETLDWIQGRADQWNTNHPNTNNNGSNGSDAAPQAA